MSILKLSTLFAVLVAFGLALGTAPQPAAAQTAKKLDCKGCVKSKQIKNAGIKGKDLKDNAIDGAKVQDDSLTGADVQDGSVGSSDITDDSLTAADLGDEGGTDYASGGANPNLAVTPSTILSVTITSPRAGHVIVNTSGYFFYDTNGGAATCSITTGATVDLAFEIRTQVVGPATDTEFTPFAGTRGFQVPAGSTTFNLVCVEDIANVAVRDAVLTAMYFPTLY